MFTMPIITFFAVQSFFSPTGSNEGVKNNATMYAGFAAVFVTNLVILMYVVSAFNEPDPVLAEGESLIPAVSFTKSRGKERED